MRKIKISMGSSLPSGDIINDEYMKKLVAESRWRPGVALMNGHKVECVRLKTLDGFIHKVNGNHVDKADAFDPHDWMEWRDE